MMRYAFNLGDMTNNDAERERRDDAALELGLFAEAAPRNLDAMDTKADAILRDLDPEHPAYEALERLCGALRFALGAAQNLETITAQPVQQPAAEPAMPAYPPGSPWSYGPGEV
jgi:hypothetical protein